MKKIRDKEASILVALTAPLIIYAWIAFLCALFGIFYAPAIMLLCAVVTGILFSTKILTVYRPSRSLGILLALSLSVSIAIAFVAEPSVFGGRDQGSISDAAFLLQKNASIIHVSPEVSIFAEIYGAGQSLHFPGFHYTVRGELFPQFPLPYIAFLAGFVGLFGMTGFLVANSILTFFFLLLTTMCVRSLIHTKASWWFFTLLISSFPVLWFAKFTLSENLAGTLVWTAISLLLILRKNVHPQILWLYVATTTLLFFTRIEGLWLTPILLYSLWKIPNCRKLLTKNTWRYIWLPSVVFGIIGLTTLIMSTPFYKTVLGALLPKQIKSLLSQTGATSDPQATQSTLSFFNEFTSLLMPVYIAYGLFFPLIITACVVIYLVHKHTRHPFLILLGITAPLFLYYIAPQISADHPWMLRRFVWIILPITLGATVLAAHLWSNRKSAQLPTNLSASMKFLLASVIFINLFTTTKYIAYAPNKTLLEQTASLAKNFTPNDLILLSPEVTGDGWSMIDVPLRNYFDRHAVYFFNQNDYANLDTTVFSNVYLITPVDSSIDYQSLTTDAQAVKTFVVQTNRLSNEANTFTQIPTIVQGSITNTIYKLK